MNIPLTTQELLILAGCIVLFLLIFYPRLMSMMEMTVLKQLTEMVGKPTDVNPRAIFSRQNYHEAAKSVQRALAHNFKATNWSIKVVTIQDPIEKSIRVTGRSVLAPSTNTTTNTPSSDPRKGERPMPIVVQVDVFHEAGGSRIVWIYSPEDPTEFQRRVQMNDKSVSLLLGRTNYSLIRELHARKHL